FKKKQPRTSFVSSEVPGACETLVGHTPERVLTAWPEHVQRQRGTETRLLPAGPVTPPGARQVASAGTFLTSLATFVSPLAFAECVQGNAIAAFHPLARFLSAGNLRRSTAAHVLREFSSVPQGYRAQSCRTSPQRRHRAPRMQSSRSA